MSPFHLHVVLLLPLCLLLTPSPSSQSSSSSSHPFLLPISKRPSSLHYLSSAHFHPSPSPVDLLLDLSGPSSSIRCSSPGSTRRLPCRSLPCLSAEVNGNVFCWDGGSACGVRGVGELVSGDASFGLSRDFRVPGLLYGCAADTLLSGMGRSVHGVLGLGRSSRVSLPFQVAASYDTPTRFSLCLSSSRGILLLGGGLSDSPSFTAVSSSLTYTPLVAASSGDSSHDYRIGLSSINVNGVSLLSSSETSPRYLARLSTTIPYTKMPTPLYEAFSAAILDAATSAGMKLAKAVRPFGLCFEQGNKSQADPTLSVELVLQSAMVKWTIYGRNLMVRAGDEVVCLGFVDGGAGLGRQDEVVLGGHQLEDVFLEFDYGRSMLGFSPALASTGTSCERLALDLSSNDMS